MPTTYSASSRLFGCWTLASLAHAFFLSRVCVRCRLVLSCDLVCGVREGKGSAAGRTAVVLNPHLSLTLTHSVCQSAQLACLAWTEHGGADLVHRLLLAARSLAHHIACCSLIYFNHIYAFPFSLNVITMLVSLNCLLESKAS